MMRPTSAELRRVCRFRDDGVQGLRDLGEHVAHAKGGGFVKDNSDDLRSVHGDRGVRFGIA